MKFLRLTILPVAAVLGGALGFTSLAAQGTVTGQVTDAETGQPLSEAQMVVVGTNIGVLTNAQGRYLITRVPAGPVEIRAVLLGFGQVTQAVTVEEGQSVVLDFQLTATAIALEALVVTSPTGRQQRARELGTASAQLDVAALNPAPITSIADVLSGRSEGVMMQDINGTTGTAQRIRIRGANSLSLDNEPLVFLDGVQISTEISNGLGVGGQDFSRLNDINPNDIENIEIVKGPAASALYGTAAANGVILITTKRGRPGETRWNFFAETGQIEDEAPYPKSFGAYQIDDASQPLFGDDGWFNTNGYTWCRNSSAAAGACTQDATLSFNSLRDPRTTPFQTGFRNRYGASISGGSDQIRYFVSGQYEDEEGVIYFNTMDKLNLRANLDAAVTENVDLSVSFGYTDSRVGLNNNDNSIFSPILNGLASSPYYIPPEEGEFPEGVPNDDNFGWGYNLYELENDIVYQEVDRMSLSSSLVWRPLSWLTVTGSGGIDLTDLHNNETVQPGKIFAWEEIAKGYRDSERENRYLYSGVLSGVGTFELTPELISTTTMGAQYTQDKAQSTECYGSSLVAGTASCGTTSALFDVDEDFFKIVTIGGFLRQEFAWRDRVFLAAGIRGDDNSAFGANFGFVYYPSASLSWVIGEEDWFPELTWMSGLRLRTAYGTSGLRPGMRDAVTLYAPTTVATDAGDAPGVVLNTTGNTKLEPEKSTEYELGFDAGFFRDRLGVEFTYFNKESRDALISRQLPGSLGLTTTVFQNLGSIKNSGTELAMNLNVLDREEVGLNVGFTNTTLKNEVLELGEDVEDITLNRGIQRHTPGYSAGGFWQRKVVYDDADGNGLLSTDEVSLEDDVSYLGTALPKWQRTFFADIRVFDWITVSTYFEGRGGHMTANDTEAFRCYLSAAWGSGEAGCFSGWSPDASLYDQARHISYTYNGSMAMWIEPADFWKWRELSIAFDMPTYLTNRASALEGLRVTLAGRNLATWTDYSGIDPETVEAGGTAAFHQSEFNTQPPVRYLMIRLDYSF